MQATEALAFEANLTERRNRLESLRSRIPDSTEIETLLREVDQALNRLGEGSYGLCEQCHDPIEQDRLLADPLVRFCVDHLNAREKKALEDDLETARRVQTALLPQQRQSYPGWEIFISYKPAGVVSGDYCDVVVKDGFRSIQEGAVPSLLLLLGDVAGKGVGASLLMSHLHATFRSLSIQEDGIDRMIGRANRLLCESTQPSHYATLVCVQASQTGDLTICNAGHCPPLLANRSGVSTVATTSLPLGLFCSGSFPSTALRMETGDVLLLYSDGLIEAENAQGEQYGIDRLKMALREARALDAETVSRTCWSNCKDFLSDETPSDDVTLMTVRRTGLT